jgi:lysophospholipase L1-like esterase
MPLESELAKLFAMLVAVVGPTAASHDLNVPSKLILKPGDQIIAIGDSITQAGGYLTDVDAVLKAKYPELKLPPIKNVGIGGQKAEDLVARFERDVIAQKPAVVTISIGINDVWHRLPKPHDPKVLASYWTNVATMVDMAQKAGIKVILLTPTLIYEELDAPGNLRLRVYIEAEKQVAREKRCTLIDLHHRFLVATANRPHELKSEPIWLTSDGVHMRPAGDALMALGVLHGLGVPD